MKKKACSLILCVYIYMWWWRGAESMGVRIRDVEDIRMDGFQCSPKQLRRTQGPGCQSPSPSVSVTYCGRHLNLTPNSPRARTHKERASSLQKTGIVYLSHQNVSPEEFGV